MRLIQLNHPKHGRRVALVDDPILTLINPDFTTCYDLFVEMIKQGSTPANFIPDQLMRQTLNYDEVYHSASEWKILPAFDHPASPLSCILSGTGLTHRASAENRQNMHQKIKNEDLTDSMKIYLWGEEGGKPGPGAVGVQPEWFYKGNGTSLKAYGEPLHVPAYGNDGGEEPEIAGIYLIPENGTPYRVGFAVANEFSDHVMEKKNYLYLAPSKLRECAIGPELVLNHSFKDIHGRVSVTRGNKTIWSKSIRSGEKNMCHSLENLEHHHFKYAQHRIPGTVHIHFFGADAFSYGEGISLKDQDLMSISFDHFGRPLANPVSIVAGSEQPVRVRTF